MAAPALVLAPRVIELMGVRIHELTEAQCVRRIFDELARGQGGWVVTPNLDHLRRFERSPEFRALYAEATITVADGMPLIWASRLQRTPLPERVAGSDLIWSLSAEAAVHGRSIYLLGGDPGTAAETGEILRARYPGLKVAGADCPPLGFERDPAQLARTSELIVAARPDLVFVGLGSPKQEVVIGQIRVLLPSAWWLGVGISFSFATGRVQRAPVWMQRLGVEWVHRLAQEPGRLARRYLVEGLPFAARLLVSSALK